MRRLFCAILVVALLSGCDGAREQTPAESAPPSTGVVDSVLPMNEAIRRFRADLPAVTEMTGGTRSQNELVRQFMLAVQHNDTGTVRRLHISRAEYAYLYFPSSRYVNEPYLQSPSVAWFLNAQSSDKGIARVMQRLGGHDIGWTAYACAEQAREGDNSFYRACMVEYLDPQTKTRISRRLFGAIIARGGQHKFLSYANDF